MTKHKSHFTLIELLVVISIISVLASLLLPSLSVARKRGYSISCASNQKQIGLAMLSYAVDWNEYLVPYKQGGGEVFWTEALMGCTSTAGVINGPYMSINCYACPSQMRIKSERMNGTSDWWRITNHYGVNLGMYPGATTATDRSCKLGSFKNISGKIWLVDTWDIDSGVINNQKGYLRWYIKWTGGLWVDNGSGWVARRHLGATNTLYLDGHVKSIQVPVSDPGLAPEFTRPANNAGLLYYD